MTDENTPDPDIPEDPIVPPRKSKSFQNIEDLLNIEGAGTTPGFDDDNIEAEKKKMEERRAQVLELKKQLAEYKNLPANTYMDTVSRMLVEKGLVMLDSIQREIEDAPRGRDVETAAAMMSSINGIIDNINKQKIYDAKIDIEKQKLELKKGASSGNLNGPSTAIQNNFFGSTTELIEMLQGKKPFPDAPIKDAKDVKIVDDEHKDII